MKTLFTITAICIANINFAQQSATKDTTNANDYGARIYNPSLGKYVGDTTNIKDCKTTILYYPNGKKKEDGCFVKGVKEGRWNEYSEDGALRFEWNYLNNEKNGVYRVLYKTGELNAIGYYKGGALIDTLTIYDKNGFIVSKNFFIQKKYKTSTMIWQRIYVKNAKPDGTIETVNGKRYYWDLGQKLELKKK